MKNLSTQRAGLSKNSIDILKKISCREKEEEQPIMNIRKNFDFGNYKNDNIEYKENQYPAGDEHKVHDNALGVLYRSLNDNKGQRKPLVYFFVGLIIGVISTLFLSAVVWVSDKDTIENDVKTVKETVKENIIDSEKQTVDINPDVMPQPTAEGITENEDGTRVYVVKEGDTLGGIVNRLYGDSSSYNPEKVEKFKEANGLKSIHALKIGQKLIIPD